METELILQIVSVIFVTLSAFFGVEMKLAKNYSKRSENHLAQIVDFFQVLNDGWEDDDMTDDEWKKIYDKANVLVDEFKKKLPQEKE